MTTILFNNRVERNDTSVEDQIEKDFLTPVDAESGTEHSAESVLSDRDSTILQNFLDAPANPNQALRRAAEKFKQAVQSGVLKIETQDEDFISQP